MELRLSKQNCFGFKSRLRLVVLMSFASLISSNWASFSVRKAIMKSLRNSVEPEALNSSILESITDTIGNSTVAKETTAAVETSRTYQLTSLPVEHKNHTMVYVHVGKTGGTSLDGVLRSNCEWYRIAAKKDCCLNFMNGHPDAVISRRTKATTHYGARKTDSIWMDDVTAFLVTLRNPLSRTVSGFNMEHPVNKNQSLQNIHPKIKQFFVECFPTIQNMTDAILSNQPEDAECSKMAKLTLMGQGQRGIPSHLFWNYDTYGKYTYFKYSHRPIFAARTEHLWSDISQLDKLLGGTGEFPSISRKSTPSAGYAVRKWETWGSESYAIRSGFSSTGKQVACCYLAKEFTIYEDLINKAINLSPFEKNESLFQAYQDCGLFKSSLTDLVAWKVFGMEGKPFPWEKWATSNVSGCHRELL